MISLPSRNLRRLGVALAAGATLISLSACMPSNDPPAKETGGGTSEAKAGSNDEKGD